METFSADPVSFDVGIWNVDDHSFQSAFLFLWLAPSVFHFALGVFLSNAYPLHICPQDALLDEVFILFSVPEVHICVADFD